FESGSEHRACLFGAGPGRRERSHSDRRRATASASRRRSRPRLHPYAICRRDRARAGGSDWRTPCRTLAPLTHGFVGHANSARREHLLDHAEAQGKPEIEPYGVADDLRVEPLRRRQSKGAATDMPGLKPPRDTPTLRRLRLEARLAYLP